MRGPHWTDVCVLEDCSQEAVYYPSDRRRVRDTIQQIGVVLSTPHTCVEVLSSQTEVLTRASRPGPAASRVLPRVVFIVQPLLNDD